MGANLASLFDQTHFDVFASFIGLAVSAGLPLTDPMARHQQSQRQIPSLRVPSLFPPMST
jgi:hypothetical protein